MQYKLSKSDWKRIGQKMGWLKEAQAHPLKDDPMFGRIVDHNARAEAASNDEAQNMTEEAKAIRQEAEEAGYKGLKIDEKGRIVKSSLVKDWLGRGEEMETETIKSWTRPFSSEGGKHYWFSSSSNAPDGYSGYHGGRPSEGRTYPEGYRGLRGEDIDSDDSPSETARRMGM